MVYKIHLERHVKQYLKKIKEKPLRQKFVNAIYDEIAKNPYAFDVKVGDLAGYYTYSFKYKGIAYRIAYSINNNELSILIILAGTHEDFYQELKRIINKN